MLRLSRPQVEALLRLWFRPAGEDCEIGLPATLIVLEREKLIERHQGRHRYTIAGGFAAEHLVAAAAKAGAAIPDGVVIARENIREGSSETGGEPDA